MTIQQIEYVLAVNKYRHFAKAAEYCNVTQPTLSAMIQKLEDELEAKIFDRNTQPVSVTEIGEKVIEEAKHITEYFSRIKDVVSEEKKTVQGVFKLAVLPTIAPYLLPRFFPNLMFKYPKLDVRIIEMKTSQIAKAIREGEVDAAIIANEIEDKTFINKILFYEEFFVYTSRKERIFEKERVKTTDITGERLWLLDEGHCFRDQMIKFCQLEKVRLNQIAYSLGSMETFMRMVESGKGITFIPQLAIEQFSDEQKEMVRPFAIPTPTRPIVLVTKNNFIKQSILNVIINEISNSIPPGCKKLKQTQYLV